VPSFENRKLNGNEGYLIKFGLGTFKIELDHTRGLY
jgi:hypothetical protein